VVNAALSAAFPWKCVHFRVGGKDNESKFNFPAQRQRITARIEEDKALEKQQEAVDLNRENGLQVKIGKKLAFILLAERFKLLPFMKLIPVLLVLVMLTGACSSPKKTPAKAPAPVETPADKLRGGGSFSKAIVIRVATESAGMDEEYKWLNRNFPGYGLIRKTQVSRSGRHYDIVRIKTRQGRVKEIYFDTTSFWGKY
jgi:hypothetical protein